MILSNESIKELINGSKIKILPYQESAIGAVGIDLHLGDMALNPDTGEEIELSEFHLSLDEFLIANTKEHVEIPGNLVARIVPRSSIARLGVLVTFDADILPPNYSGKPILTIRNLSKKPVLLKSGLAMCQIIFEQVDKEVKGYQSRYAHDKPEASKL